MDKEFILSTQTMKTSISNGGPTVNMKYIEFLQPYVLGQAQGRSS